MGGYNTTDTMVEIGA